MTTATAPPPTEAPEAKGFNIDGFASSLASDPMEETGAGQQPAPEPPPTTEPPKPEQPKVEEEPANAQAKRSAKFILGMFDRLQANVFSTISVTEPPEKYKLTQDERREAEEYLAQGIEESGNFNVPWYVPLIVVLGMSSWMNWQRAKRARDLHQQAEEAKDRARRAAGGASRPVSPDSITTPDGTTIPVTDPPPPPPPAAPPPPVMRPVDPSKLTANCLWCKKPIRKGKKYCGQSCAGKGAAHTRKPRPTNGPTA
jgi:hypothetical protein